MTWPPPNTRKVTVAYEHTAGRGMGVQRVQLAMTTARPPLESDWQATAFDVDHGLCGERHGRCRRVVWARFAVGSRGAVWLRDSDGVDRKSVV